MTDQKHRLDNDHQFLGFDFSTQQLKAVVTNNNLEIVHVATVQFDVDFPHYRNHPSRPIEGGVYRLIDGKTVIAPVLMWVEAIDLVLERLKEEGVKFSKIVALSGAGQQHGSVYWSQKAEEKLRSLKADANLKDQMTECFSVEYSPIWMDSSTDEQCKKMVEAIGGDRALAELTGSKAFHRFTGPQISKIYEQNLEAYKNTERISLVSSFACSIFLGKYAPIDYADGSGMNLLNIRTRKWDERCLKVCAENLAEKLADPVPSNSVLGKINPYFVNRYGFSPDCSVVAFTGDNPASLAGLNLHKEDIAISLGTSDTVFAWLSEPVVTDGHIFCNPLQVDAFMALLCFKNGSLTRERIRQKCQCSTWEDFNQLLSKTTPGNNGNIGFYFDSPEILPNVPAGDFRYSKEDKKVDEFDPATEARALIEHQTLAKRSYLERMHKHVNGRVFVTGGASLNAAILQVLADVFGAKVYTQNVPHSAALGCAYRAKHALMDNVAFHEVCKHATNFVLAAEPNLKTKPIYDEMVQRYQKMEQTMISEGQNK